MIKCKNGKVTISDADMTFQELGHITQAVKQMFVKAGVEDSLVNTLVLEVVCKSLGVKGEKK